MSDIVVVNLRTPKECKLHVRYPYFIRACKLIPHAANNMDVHDHREDQVEDFVGSFLFRTGVEVHDDVTDSAESQDLKSTKKLKERVATKEI